jgi:hypothetical protein
LRLPLLPQPLLRFCQSNTLLRLLQQLALL